MNDPFTCCVLYLPWHERNVNHPSRVFLGDVYNSGLLAHSSGNGLFVLRFPVWSQIRRMLLRIAGQAQVFFEIARPRIDPDSPAGADEAAVLAVQGIVPVAAIRFTHDGIAVLGFPSVHTLVAPKNGPKNCAVGLSQLADPGSCRNAVRSQGPQRGQEAHDDRNGRQTSHPGKKLD